MELLRLATFGAIALLCTGGSLASVAAYFGGNPTNYSAAIDSSAIPILATGLLVATIVLAFVPAPAQSEDLE